MTEATKGIDSLGLFLTGGASNRNPDASLGGTVSSTRIRGMGSQVSSEPIPGVQIDEVFPSNGEGSGNLEVDSNNDLIWTPPGGTPGTPVTIAEGDSCVVTGGGGVDQAVLVTREAGLGYAGVDTPILRFPFNGALAHANVSSANRIAGLTTYRGVMLHARGPNSVENIRIWLPIVAGAQATYAIGLETAVGSTIQTIADELTAPAAVVFSTPTTEGAALTLSLGPGTYHGLWIRRVFPAAGTVSAEETFQLAIKYEGAG